MWALGGMRPVTLRQNRPSEWTMSPKSPWDLQKSLVWSRTVLWENGNVSGTPAQRGDFFHKVQSEVVPLVKLPRLSQRDQVVLCRIRLGHCRLNAYLHRIAYHPTGFCDVCRKPEDLNHLFLNFPLYGESRQRIVRHIRVMGIRVLDLQVMLRRMDWKHPQLCKAVLKFLKECGRPI